MRDLRRRGHRSDRAGFRGPRHGTPLQGQGEALTARGARANLADRRPEIFISYSHRDERARSLLDKHLAQLMREGVSVWFDGDILPGAEIDPAIMRRLKRADVFVALASPDYLQSAYCYEKEYGFAMRKARRMKLHVVVAVLRACQWRHTRMARYKLLPKDGRPIDQWARRGDAYEDVVEGIRLVLRQVRLDRQTVPDGTSETTKAASGSKRSALRPARPKKAATPAGGLVPKAKAPLAADRAAAGERRGANGRSTTARKRRVKPEGRTTKP